MVDIPSRLARSLANAYEFGGSCPQQGHLFALLTRFRSDDMNMRSVWLCSHNDLINNTGVILAAGLVAWLNSPWPETCCWVS